MKTPGNIQIRGNTAGSVIVVDHVACVAREFGNLAGFVLFDDRFRFEIEVPKPTGMK